MKKILVNRNRETLVAAAIAVFAVAVLGWMTLRFAMTDDKAEDVSATSSSAAQNDKSLDDAGKTAETDAFLDPLDGDARGIMPGQLEPTVESQPQGVRYTSQVLAGDVSKVLDFDYTDYLRATGSGKTVVLYFYADWCPICQREVAGSFYPAFESLDDEDLVGFRVNFNDGNTDSYEKELAKEFGVAYQHTKVIVRDGERLLKSPEEWDKDRYLSEINKLK